MTILIMTCSNSAKWLTFMTCSKSAKWQLCFLTSSKLAKWLIIMTSSKLAVFNKAIQGTFFKSQKSKNRHKSYLLWEAVANRAIHGTFLSLKKVKKKSIWKLGIHIRLWLRKMSWVALLATTRVPLPSLCMWFHWLISPTFRLCSFAILSSHCFTSELHKTKILLSLFVPDIHHF